MGDDQLYKEVPEVPDEIPTNWMVELFGEEWLFVTPDPAEVFQMVNKAKSSSDVDMETLFNMFWERQVLPKDRPAGQKPALFDLKGSKENNEAFAFIVGVFRKHFLGGAPI